MSRIYIYIVCRIVHGKTISVYDDKRSKIKPFSVRVCVRGKIKENFSIFTLVAQSHNMFHSFLLMSCVSPKKDDFNFLMITSPIINIKLRDTNVCLHNRVFASSEALWFYSGANCVILVKQNSFLSAQKINKLLHIFKVS